MFKLGDATAAYEALHRAHELNPLDSGTAAFLFDASINLARKSSQERNTRKRSDISTKPPYCILVIQDRIAPRRKSTLVWDAHRKPRPSACKSNG
jgi:hypothetical protein